MINWEAIATPPRLVPEFMKVRIRYVHSTPHKGDFEFWGAWLDKMDLDYFGPSPAEPKARGKQADLLGGVA